MSSAARFALTALLLATGLSTPALAKSNKPAEAPAGGKPLGDWRVGAVTTETGAFSYCAAENSFDNNLVLVIGRNPAGEVNVGVGIPKAGLVTGQDWQVAVTLDGKIKRLSKGVAVDGEFLVVELGKDEEFFNALVSGRSLSVQGPSDAAVFQLKGTSKAITELRKCVSEGKAAKTTTVKSAPTPPPVPATLPPPLAEILKRAGLKDVQPLALGNLPPDQRPADYAWRTGPMFGGLLEAHVADGRGLNALTTAYIEGLKRKCTGAFDSSLGEVETVNEITLRTGTATCEATKDDKTERIHVSLLFYLTQTQLFEVFFHEAPEDHSTTADQARDALTGVIRQLAAQPAKAN